MRRPQLSVTYHRAPYGTVRCVLQLRDGRTVEAFANQGDRRLALHRARLRAVAAGETLETAGWQPSLETTPLREAA